MADNLNVTPGSGSTIGMDSVVDGTLGTVLVGFGKIMDGTLDSTNKLIVNSSGEAKVTPTANSTVDVNKLAGTTTDTNSGNKSAGTLRVVLATDQPALTNKLLVTPDSVALPANQSVNVSQINGVTPLMGNGVTGTGSQRVTIASDNTAFSVNATLSAETTKVIGVTRTSDGSGNLLTSNSSTYTAKFALDGNLLGTLGTAFSTAGKVDVKAADGDVFVRSNAASTFPTQATLQTQTDTVMIGGVNIKEINAVTPLMGNGTTGTGSQRVTIASDNTAFAVNATLQSNTGVDIGKLTANQSVNVAQMNGVATSMGVGASGTGTQRIVIANDNGKTILSKGGSAASNGNNTLVAAGTNKLKIKAFSLTTTSTTAMTCIFQDGASGTELWRVVLQAITGASTGANLAVNAPDWIFATSVATLLNLNLSSANAVHWSLSYFDEA